jgi:hypothetical protein
MPLRCAIQASVRAIYYLYADVKLFGTDSFSDFSTVLADLQ